MIKICGLSTPEALEAAIAAGADMVGFVRCPPSPRHVDLRTGRVLSAQAAGRAARVLLVVDPSDVELDEAVAAIEPDLIQLHGAETPERVAAIARAAGRPIIKPRGGAGAAPPPRGPRSAAAPDRVLLDAKPPPGASRPGGNGVGFDWSLLSALRVRRVLDGMEAPMLSGGLAPGNVARAIAATGFRAVDVSSGVESSPGRKDPARIAAFVAAARAAFASADQERITA